MEGWEEDKFMNHKCVYDLPEVWSFWFFVMSKYKLPRFFSGFPI